LTVPFEFKLDKIDQFLGANPLASTAPAPGMAASSLTAEEVIRRVLPAVVTVRSDSRTGTGFFILDIGILVTNKHVVGDASQVSIVTGKGELIDDLVLPSLSCRIAALSLCACRPRDQSQEDQHDE
jgi:S1-C subfamily serine protease